MNFRSIDKNKIYAEYVHKEMFFFSLSGNEFTAQMTRVYAVAGWFFFSDTHFNYRLLL